MTNWGSPTTRKLAETNSKLNELSRKLDETNRLLSRLVEIEESRAAKTGDLPKKPASETKKKITLPGVLTSRK